jgi:hypothetical protein
MTSLVGRFLSACFVSLACCAGLAQAQDITVWRFNLGVLPASPVPDSGPGTATAIGGTGGAANGGSPSDTASGTPPTNQSWNLTGYPAQGTASGTAGVQFNVPTTGFDAINVAWDTRASNTASRWTQLQISTNGSTFTNFGGPIEHTAGGDQWMVRSFSLASVPGVANNPNFAFRVVAIFSPNAFNNGATPVAANAGYQAANLTSVYPGTSALRYDRVTVSGTARPFSPVSVASTVSPAALCATDVGTTLNLVANVTAGLNPVSTFANPASGVTINLSAINGPASFSLTNQGDDATFAGAFNLPAGVTPGAKTLQVTVRDDQNRTATFNASVGVADCGFSSTNPVVISAAYPYGANAGPPTASFNADYIEIYNRSASPVNLDGYSIQTAGATTSAGFASTDDLVALSGTILPGQYKLIRFSDPGTVGADLPLVDFARPAGGGGLANTDGRVALVNTTTLPGQNCASPTIVDLVGYGRAVCFTGLAAAPEAANDNAVLRKNNGQTDSRQNFFDFTAGAPTPRNRAAGGFLAGFASIDTAIICRGNSVNFSTQTFAGANPASSSIQVRTDLSAIGGSANQALTPGSGGLFTLNYLVPANTPQGVYAITITTSDAQGRTDVTSVSLAVADCTPSSSPVVIAGFFGGGGNGANSVNADYVELLNRTAQPIDLNGWSVQYASNNGPNGFNEVAALTGSILPGQYFLVRMGPIGAQGAPLPTPDAVAVPSITMDNSSGRIALVRSTTLIGNNFSSPLIADLVGYGSAINFFGVAAAPRINNTLLGLRIDDGCTDRRQNALDFVTGPSDQFPRNSQSPGVTCPPLPAAGCNPADIADNGSNPGADGCVDNGDFSLFISQFFNSGIQAGCTGANIPCAASDIADNGSNPGADGLLDNGDFSLFISSFFGANCTATCNP